MPDSPFITAMNAANTSFGVATTETFEVMKTGNIGIYDAISIDDLTSATAVAAGGLRGENDVSVWISRAVLVASGIVEGTILKVRNKRVRVVRISDDGDNTPMLQCATAGIKL